MVTTVQGGSYAFKQSSVGGYWYWTVKADNTQGVGQLYQVTDIETPYGPLVNTQLPIPGDIILAMADSLRDVQSQLAPLLALVQPAVTLFPITITEGDSDRDVGSVDFQNVGAYGSFMSVSATPDSAWLVATPSSFQGIGKNETDTVGISLLTSALTSASSPYSGVVNLQDDRDPPTVIPITVTVIVLPRPVILASPASLSLSYIIATATPSGPATLTVQNSGLTGSILNYSIAKLNNVDWLDVSPSSGGPLGAGQSATASISVVPAKVPSIPGTYTETLRVSSDNASNSPVDVTVSLIVS